MAFIEGTDIRKSYGDQPVLQGVNIRVEKGKTLSVLGKSGCGKTTLLKIMAGLEAADGGSISMDGKSVMMVPPEQRGFVYLFQETLLFPHLDVFDNISFGLKIRGVGKNEIKRRIEAMLDLLQLNGHINKMPHQLSGGQQQRVSFGRALIVEPRLLLLDEPFGKLDMETREAMQILFKNVAKKFEISSVFVTHDLKEALLMGDEWGVLDRGVLDTYTARKDFISDGRTGFDKEKSFWENLSDSNFI